MVAGKGRDLPRAVFDTNILVSAFLTRHRGSLSFELLRAAGAAFFDLVLSDEIVAETRSTLTTHPRTRRRYGYSDADVTLYCEQLMRLAELLIAPPPIPGAVPQDADDDKIVACAVAGGVRFIVTRDAHLLDLLEYEGIAVTTPEAFMALLRGPAGPL